MKLPTIDHTCGIDRNPDSKQHGQIVLGGKGMIPILLWRRPGCEFAPENITGALTHDYEVKVVRRIVYEKRPYYFVRTSVQHKGKDYPQKGWLPNTLLKELGAT
jgi:hypothetical protein